MKHQNLKIASHLFKNQDKNHLYEILLMKNNTDEKYLTKKLVYKRKNLKYKLMTNEAKSLKLISQHFNGNVPKFHSIDQRKNQLILTREYIAGRKIAEYPSKFKLQTLLFLIVKLKELSQELSPLATHKLKKISPLALFCVFPFYFIKALIKEPQEFIILLKNFYLFYLNFISSDTLKLKYRIAHKDIHPDNIVVCENQPYLLDWEFLALAEEETDLAISCRYFSTYLNNQDLIKLIKLSSTDHKQFTRLSIFYTIKLIGAENKDDGYYKQAVNYLSIFLDKILPNL